MYKVGAQFLTADENHKKEHLDPKNENLGYCNIEGVRDFIKVYTITILITIHLLSLSYFLSLAKSNRRQK